MVLVSKWKKALKSFLQIIVLALFLGGVFLSLDRLSPFIPGLHDYLFQPAVIFILTVIGAVLLYGISERLVAFGFDRCFFRSRSERLRLLESTATILLQTLDLRGLSNLIVNTLAELFQQKVVLLALYRNSRYEIASSWGITGRNMKKMQLAPESPLLKYLEDRLAPISRETFVRQLSWPDVYEYSKEFEAMAVSYLVPIHCNSLWMGFLGLSGTRNARAFFPREEEKALCDFVSTAALALKNAMAYEDLRQVNEKLKDLQSKILQTTKLTAIEQLAAGLAHEIHNPLTIISGKAQLLLLRKGAGFDEKLVEEVLKTIVKQTERAADITRKLLMFSKPVSTGRDIILFDNIVDDTLALISYQTTLDEITILKNISKEMPPFRGEVNEIREIFLNLILNAVQAVERRGTVQIQASHLLRERVIEIRIRDNGRGIRGEHIPQLFNPFFSLREGGVGLGLFITQQIVHRYHGSIHLESEPGVGTLVMVHLPVEEDLNEAGPVLSESEKVPVK